MSKVTFVDNIGRTVYGELVSKTETVLQVKNPAVINVQVAQNGSLSVSLLPLFLGELISPETRKNGTVWDFNLSSITLGDVVVDSRLDQQYANVFNTLNVQAPTTPPVGDTPVIKLFDE